MLFRCRSGRYRRDGDLVPYERTELHLAPDGALVVDHFETNGILWLRELYRYERVAGPDR